MSSDLRGDAQDIFLFGVDSVKPGRLLHRQLFLDDQTLTIEKESFDLDHFEKIVVIGAGKASALMAQTLEEILGGRISEGLVCTKYDHEVFTRKIEVVEAAHPYPDKMGQKAAMRLKGMCENRSPNDLVIILISGGASSLLADFDESISLSDYKTLNQLLVESGASIQEINTIRKKLGYLKGGKLSQLISPAQSIALILSDVIGDSLQIIGSGLTVEDASTMTDCFEILEKYDLERQLPASVAEVLHQLQDTQDQHDKPNQQIHPLIATKNFVIGSLKVALHNAGEKAKSLGYRVSVKEKCLAGQIDRVAESIITLIEEEQATNQHGKCILMGGEPTLKVNGKGSGGRNQHLALLLAEKLKETTGVTILVGASDGTDGNTNATGAVVDNSTYTHESSREKNSIESYLANFDSFHFFENTPYHIITGPTHTNVMDIIVILIE